MAALSAPINIICKIIFVHHNIYMAAKIYDFEFEKNKRRKIRIPTFNSFEINYHLSRMKEEQRKIKQEEDAKQIMENFFRDLNLK